MLPQCGQFNRAPSSGMAGLGGDANTSRVSLPSVSSRIKIWVNSRVHFEQIMTQRGIDTIVT